MESIVEELINELSPKFDVVSTIDETKCSSVAVKHNVCYIVAAIIIEDDKVLMIREAKLSCRGSWYLPAGRMEKNETIEAAVKREVKEESGIDIDVTSMICVESPFSKWFRFTFTGRAVGGSLKTLKDEDKESMEAAWVPIKEIYNQRLQLRATDIIKLISHAEVWYKRNPSPELHLLPNKKPHSSIIVRVFLVRKSSECIEIFVGSDKKAFIEVPDEVRPKSSLSSFINLIISNNGYKEDIKIHGVISMEHTGQIFGKSDGIFFIFLAEATTQNNEALQNGSWIKIENTELAERIRHIMENNSCSVLIS